MYLRQNREFHKSQSYRTEQDVQVRLINRRRLKEVFEPSQKKKRKFSIGEQVSVFDGLTVILGVIHDNSHPSQYTVEDCQGFFHLVEEHDSDESQVRTLCMPTGKFAQGYDQRKSGASALTKPASLMR